MSNQEILARAIECFGNPGHRSRYFDLYDDDIVLHGYAGVGPGLASVKDFYKAFWNAFPDARVEAKDIVEQKDKIALRFAITATHRGVFQGIAPTGNTVFITGISILQFSAGKCVERWSVVDFFSLLAQLGAIPSRA